MFKALACAAALTVCATGAAFAASDAPVKYNIQFTGYCDGVQLNVYKGIYTTGVATGPNCAPGGPAGALEQGLQTSVNKFGGLVVTTNYNQAPLLATFALDLTKQTFKIYESNGQTYVLVNKGKFTFVQGANTATGPTALSLK